MSDWKNDQEFMTTYNNFTCEYIPAQIELAYYFWKKSRECLVVELPEWDNYDTTKQCIAAFSEEMEALGIKHK